jgi:hypothetical protein
MTGHGDGNLAALSQNSEKAIVDATSQCVRLLVPYKNKRIPQAGVSFWQVTCSAMDSLKNLDGVRTPTASAVLDMNPKVWPVIDVQATKAIWGTQLPGSSGHYYYKKATGQFFTLVTHPSDRLML